MSGSKIFTVDKFLGLNEAADGATELKMGEASKIENFYITDGYNIQSRPGVKCEKRYSGSLLGFRTGKKNESSWFLTVTESEGGVSAVLSRDGTEETRFFSYVDINCPVKMFDFGDTTYILAKHSYSNKLVFILVRDGAFAEEEYDFYVPLAITGMAPAGGGTVLEPLNILSPYFLLQFSADGEAAAYQLPSTAGGVVSVTVDGTAAAGTYDSENHTFTFESPPVKGVNNVEFRCYVSDDNADYEAAFLRFFRMKHSEAYNGATDTRLFFYGDGTNVCYYTGTPAYGDGLYVPAGNEISFDASPTPITGMSRHYTRLMVFQQDNTSSVSYEPVTLEDGSVIAGFFVRPASRSVGNEMDGQVQTVNNYPRTLCGGSLYEWRHSASYYQDERYAKRVSGKIAKTLAGARATKIVTCDDDPNKTYYMFLNDDDGTVLVNRYDLDAWTVYKGAAFRNILHARVCGNKMLFAGDGRVCSFDPSANYDAPILEDGEPLPVEAVWESGYMAFGADYKRKYSSHIWLSMLPEIGSNMDVTVSTDRREDYLVKSVGLSLFSLNDLDFSAFSFIASNAPKIQRIQMKVKKFVYYKLIFRVSHPGACATVLGYDQQVRYSSNVK